MKVEDELRDALIDMVEQFAFEGQKDGLPALWTGGLSALEHAFGVLGWDDPYPALDRKCEIPECNQFASCGRSCKDGIYRRLCGTHYTEQDTE